MSHVSGPFLPLRLRPISTLRTGNATGADIASAGEDTSSSPTEPGDGKDGRMKCVTFSKFKYAIPQIGKQNPQISNHQ